ncbi:AraC family transcriptional regulator [Nocardia sp. CDC159]|uniref:AraC family transcriptional regulator n=1 Tax=Nocardia pulmonis TaxID=2951408 RepID=A0A9X2J1A0_9NOCA|nr:MULTISPECIES: AraC family transcriptional regulator [Nocardia]MCM6778674.1 AraC family transcriptional regulator [Nocardia pulmonis]MCM6791563.1 AraC family transcriptional regulator [Nocardia sp. CDC159]
MAISPDFLADPPAERVDALSEILHTVHLRGDELIRHAAAAEETVHFGPGHRLLHILESGTAELTVTAGKDASTVRSGDLVLLARGDEHALRALTPARWITGTFLVDETVAAPLLSVLPATIALSAAVPGREWLEISLRSLVFELTDPGPGTAVMISRVLDLLFVHALRAWSARDATPGWLTAAMDPALAPVLTAIHRDPVRPWTVPELAALAHLSRTTFAERFTRRLGRSPAAYVADRRLARAADLLRSTSTPISDIAHRIGYDSEAAFTRAFRRHYGQPPSRWRRLDTSSTDQKDHR